MNTDRIKNIMLVLLSVLAIVLTTLVFLDEQQYILSDEQQSNIIEILQRNNMRVSTDIPQVFRPQRQLNAFLYRHNVYGIAERFFGYDGFVRDTEGATTIITSRQSRNTITYFEREGEIVFQMPDGFFVGVLPQDFFKTATTAEELARSFIEEVLGEPAVNMQLFSNILTPNMNYQLTFFDSYRGQLLYDSRIRVHITDKGIEDVFYWQAGHSGMIGSSIPIFSADEAMFALLNHLQIGEGIEDEMDLIDMQLVYAIDNVGNRDRAVLAYLFTVTIGVNQRFNVVINAHTNNPIVDMEIVSR